jgi:AcrR family transcriptional regulator
VILEAAARILEQSGLAGYNTNAIAERAGVSIGSIYQYFPNKDALTLALIAKFEREMIGAVHEAVEAARGEDLRHSLKLVIQALLRIHEKRISLHRLLELEEDRLRQNDREANETRCLPQLIENLLSPHRSELRVPVNSATIEDLITIVHAMVNRALLNGTRAAAAERRILRAIHGYLLY